MSATAVRLAGLAGTAAYCGLIAWLYVSQPQTVAEITGGLSAQVGAYQIDQAAFADGLALFREDAFVAARSAFARADPANRDAVTQFYVAYSFYRQGFGRIRNDRALFREGLTALERATAAAPGGAVRVADPSLALHTADELRAELQAGLVSDASDLNPLRLFEPRK